MAIRRAEIKKLALRCLRDAKVVDPPVPVETIARAFGATIHREPFDGNLSGMLLQSDGRKIIGVNSLHALTRQRFTIAHEIGHMLLHPPEECHVDPGFSVRFRDAAAASGLQPAEIEANAFAAELLMPFDFLKKELDGQDIDGVDSAELISKLALRYQVSAQAMTVRLTNLGLGDVLGLP